METVNTLETPARSVDWKAVERDYCTGNLSTRAIGSTHGVSHTAVQNRARSEGWKRPDGSPPVEVESDAAAQTSAEDSAEVAKVAVATEVASEEVNKEVTKEVTAQAPVSDLVSAEDDSLSDAVLDRGARISLTRAQAEGMAMSLRELAVSVTVAEADAHPDYSVPIADCKRRRREAILRHQEAVARTVAVVEAGKRATERIEALRSERAELDGRYTALALAFASGVADAAALAEHRRAVESVDDQLAAIKAAAPLLEQQARRLMDGTEFIARAPHDIAQELANIRGAAACAIARARW